MAKLERLYTIPLRKEFLKVPKYKRSKKAVSALRDFIEKHMKHEIVKIGSELNREMLKHGRKNPPHKIRVKAVRYDDPSMVKVNLPEAKFEDPKKEVEEKSKKKRGEKEEKKTKKEVKEEEKKEVLEHAKLEIKSRPKMTKDQAPKQTQVKDRQKKVIGATGK